MAGTALRHVQDIQVMVSQASSMALSQWNLNQLQAVWSQLQTQVNPFAQVLCLDGSLYRLLDTGAKDFIAHNFM
jgi:hypothetical protein